MMLMPQLADSSVCLSVLGLEADHPTCWIGIVFALSSRCRTFRCSSLLTLEPSLSAPSQKWDDGQSFRQSRPQPLRRSTL